jgi:autotransporter-associated beta strand protein
MIGAARAGAAVPAALTADSVQQLVVVEDNAQFLTQVALMAGQVPQIKGLTSDQKSALLQGSWSDVQTAAAALVDAQVVANATSTRKTVAQQLNNQYNALTADITKLGVAVTANPLSAATQKAFQKMGQDAQALVTGIGRDYALLPVSQRPVALSLLPAAGQARVIAANATVKFVLSGPKAAITSANGTWALTSGRQDATQPPLSTPFTKGTVTGSSGNARQTMQSRSTAFGAWTYIYYQYGARRPTLLLLNLGAPGGGNTTGGSTTSGGGLGTGAISVNGGNLNVSGDDSVTIAGGILSGNGSLTKTGDGTLTLTGANTYTGGTFINAGTLIFTTLSNLGSGLTFNGGTLAWAPGNLTDISNQTIIITGNATLNPNGNNVTLTNPVGGNGTGGLTLNGNGTLTLTANATYTGNTTVNAGVLRVTSLDFPPGNIFVLGTGTFVYQPDGNDSLTVSAVPVDGSAYPWGDTTYEVDGESDGSWVLPALSAQIVAVTGGYEIVEWAGASSGSEGVGINFDSGGSLTIGGGSFAGPTLYIALNVQFNLGGPINVTFNGSVSGAGNLSVTGGEVVTLNGKDSMTGTTTVSNGVLVLTYPNLPTGDIFVQGTGIFEYQPHANDYLLVNEVPVSGSAFPWGDTTYEADEQADGSWVLPVLGVQIVAVTGGYEIVEWAGASSGSGGLDVGGATFTLLGNFGSGTLNPSGGTSGLSGNAGISVFVGNHSIIAPLVLGPTPGSANITINITTGNSLTLSGNISEAAGSVGTLTVGGNGTLILSGNNTYTGNTTINGGTLSYTNASLPPGNIVVQGSGIFEYQPDANDSLTVNAVPVDGSEYAWGNSTYEVDVQTLGVWILPEAGLQIMVIAGGYEILPWVAPEVQDDDAGSLGYSSHLQESALLDSEIAQYALQLAATDPQTALQWAAMISNGRVRNNVIAAISGVPEPTDDSATRASTGANHYLPDPELLFGGGGGDGQ